MIGRMEQTVSCVVCRRASLLSPGEEAPPGWALVGPDPSDCWCAGCLDEGMSLEIPDDPRAFVP